MEAANIGVEGVMASKDQSLECLRIATLQDALSHGLTEQEFSLIKERLDREINLLEVGVCAALFSEHCSYKSTKVHLRTLPTTGQRVIHGPGENAGVVDIGDNQAVVFKVESHNHPTYIEPFQGAATGVGGILRDVFTMGARPLALMNSLRFGDAEHPKTKYLFSRAVDGIGHYGNCMGIPTVGGETFFHSAYNGNCLVNAFALGLVDHDKVFLGEASGVGNSILYVGSKTGRDGIHGATMASEEFDDASEEKRPTVQVGDPFQEKLLLEACLEAMQSDFIVGIQDMGAAGMTSSTYEMAERAGTGLRIDLDKVPQREEGMNPYEIMLSESQERMLVVVKAGREQELIDIFARWELDAARIGTVTNAETVDLYWHGALVSSIPVEALTSSVPEYRWPEKQPELFEERSSGNMLENCEQPADLSKTWLQMLSSINLCSRQRIFDQYDSTVRSNTVIHPGGDAAVIRIKSSNSKGSAVEKGVALTLDCNSRYCAVDPHKGAALSVIEAARNITAVGAEPIGLSDCLNFGSPERPEGMWQIAQSIRGMSEACRALGIPVVSGNASLYNETKGKGILPTPTIAMVGLIADANKCVGTQFKQAGDQIFVIGDLPQTLGASEYLAQIHNLQHGALPAVNYDQEMSYARLIRSLIDKGLLNSCHDISDGGLAIALAECCFSPYECIGAELEILQEVERADLQLFGEAGPSYIFSCESSQAEQLRGELSAAGVVITLQGVVGGDVLRIGKLASISVEQGYNAWTQGLAGLI